MVAFEAALAHLRRRSICLNIISMALVVALGGCVAEKAAPEITALSPDLVSRAINQTENVEKTDIKLSSSKGIQTSPTETPISKIDAKKPASSQKDDYKFVSKARFGLPALNRTFPGTFGFSGNNIDHLLLGAGSAWQSPPIKSAGRVTTAPVLNEGRLFYGDQKGGIHAIAASNGEVLWSVWLSDKKRPQSISALFADHQVIFAGTDGGHLLAISARTGSVIWKKRVEGSIKGALRSFDDALLMRVGDQDLLALTKKKAEEKWRYKSPFTIKAMALSDGVVSLVGKAGQYSTIEANKGIFLSGKSLSEAFAGNRLVATPDDLILTGESRISRVQSGNGKLIWSKASGSEQGAITSGETVFLAGSDGLLRAFNRKNGALNWFSKLPEREGSSVRQRWTRPLLAGGRLHLASNTGYVASFNADDGKLVLLRDFKAPIQSAPIVASGRLFIVTVTGRVFRL